MEVCSLPAIVEFVERKVRIFGGELGLIAICRGTIEVVDGGARLEKREVVDVE